MFYSKSRKNKKKDLIEPLCLFNCNKSSSKSSNEINKTMINRNNLNILNQTVSNGMANALVKTNNECRSVLNQQQLMDYSGCKIKSKGDIVIGGKQDQVAKIDFDCVQASKVSNEIAQSILNSITGAITSGADDQTRAQMEAAAKARSATEFGALGSTDAKSNANNKFNLEMENINETSIQNIIQKNIESNFEAETLQQCVNEGKQAQEIALRNCDFESTEGKVVIENAQNQGIEAVAKCKQMNDVANSMVDKILTDLGVEVEATTTATSDIDQGADSDSAAESKGLGSLIGSIFGGFFNMTALFVIAGIVILFLFLYFGSDLLDKPLLEETNTPQTNVNLNKSSK
jgi:hypothetical protein